MPIRRADDTLYTLGVDLTANGSPVPIKGGEYALFVDCTGSNGTNSLQMLIPPLGNNWYFVWAGNNVCYANTTACSWTS